MVNTLSFTIHGQTLSISCSPPLMIHFQAICRPPAKASPDHRGTYSSRLSPVTRPEPWALIPFVGSRAEAFVCFFLNFLSIVCCSSVVRDEVPQRRRSASQFDVLGVVCQSGCNRMVSVG
ncbi:hypothetical protein LR48_Vigan04g115200 [Vigna angularis]|uniref:Uncharacterized protein n=1 Tax=Phaseolus angularis TaxID=3914 RepID=A0A0L9UEJ5_PHAAN|nr:hypothetical protein LR48_Vigan04g115200 [Vigna angularis]